MKSLFSFSLQFMAIGALIAMAVGFVMFVIVFIMMDLIDFLRSLKS